MSVMPLETIVAEYVALKTERLKLVQFLVTSPALSEVYQVIQRHAAGNSIHAQVCCAGNVCRYCNMSDNTAE